MFLNSIILTFGSWEWYDHDHDGTPRVCRIQLHCTETTQYNYIVPRLHNTTTLYRDFTIQLHCTDTLQLQILGSGTMMATTAPLVFVEYNYIVPTLYSCRFLGVVR